MSASRLRQGVIIFGVVLLLTFLFVQSRVVDFTAHERFTRDLRRLQEVDTTLNQDILKVRDGLLTYYDTLVTASAELNRLYQNIRRSIPSFIGAQGQRDLTRLLDAYAEVLASKTRELERFKSDNAILKNSLQYFPLVATEVAEEAGAHLPEQGPVTELKNLLRDLLVYTLLVREDLTLHLQARIDSLSHNRDAFASAVERSRLNTVLAHAQTILTYAPRVNGLIAELLALPLAQRSAALHTAYNRHYERALRTADGYRLVLYLLSVALLSYIAYIIVRLRQATQALNTANEHLEERVRERTAALQKTTEQLDQRNRMLVEQQQRLRAELADAAAYVTSRLPLPLTGDVQTAWQYIPSEQLGGDAFGYHWLDEDHLAMYLLDVCGHGVRAALLSISIANVLRSQSLPGTNFYEPAAVLQALNHTFPMEQHYNMFFTIWYGIYDKKHRRIVYASGGHPPAVLLTGAAADTVQCKQLRTPGLALGCMPELTFQQAVCPLEADSILYIFSDGVYEIPKPNGTVLTFEEFVKILTRPIPPKHADIDHIVHTMQALGDSETFADDFSILQITFA